MPFRVMLAAFCFLIGCVCPAGAQDLWTGVYAGGTIGRQTFDAHWKTTCLSDGFGICPDSGGVLAEQFNADNPVNFGDKDLRLGAFAGAQFQFQGFVFGFEGDWGKVDQDAVNGGIPGAEQPLSPTRYGPDEVRVKAFWDASARVRLGVLVSPSSMLYGTGGLSWMRVQASAICNIEFGQFGGFCLPQNVGFLDKVNQTVEGYTVGGGLETLLTDNILFRAEYRHSQYEDVRYTFFDGRSQNIDAITAQIGTMTDTVTLGFGFKF